MNENEKNYIEAAKILNEAVKEDERRKRLLDEANISIPDNKGAMQKLKALPVEKIDQHMKCRSGVLILVRTKQEASHSGNVSQHACSVKIDKSQIPIHIPRQSYLDVPKMMPNLKDYKEAKDDAKIAIRFVYDCQAILIAIWDCENAKDKEILFAMLRDKIVENDYYNNNIIKGPKSNEELEKDRAEIKARLNNGGKHKE